MRALLLFFCLALLLAAAAAGGREGQFTPPQALKPKTLPTQHVQLPTETLKPRQLPVVVHRHYIDQDVVQPETVKVPITQQQLVIQPIERVHLSKQPIRRIIKEETVVRPHVRSVITVVPKISVEKVHQDRVTDRTVVKEEYKEVKQQLPLKVEQPSISGKKTGEQLYGPQWKARIQHMLESKYAGKAPAAETPTP